MAVTHSERSPSNHEHTSPPSRHCLAGPSSFTSRQRRRAPAAAHPAFQPRTRTRRPGSLTHARGRTFEHGQSAAARSAQLDANRPHQPWPASPRRRPHSAARGQPRSRRRLTITCSATHRALLKSAHDRRRPRPRVCADASLRHARPSRCGLPDARPSRPSASPVGPVFEHASSRAVLHFTHPLPDAAAGAYRRHRTRPARAARRPVAGSGEGQRPDPARLTGARTPRRRRPDARAPQSPVARRAAATHGRGDAPAPPSQAGRGPPTPTGGARRPDD
jgi:hypothetical protein